MRYFIHLSYCGANFHGWQSQPNAVSVQSIIENALSVVMRQKISIVGAGRTDAGVNAAEMYAHFDVKNEIIDTPGLLNSLNKLVGQEIAIDKIFRVKDDAHARFDALARTYKYFVAEDKSPFNYRYVWLCRQHLDYDAMNEAAKLLFNYTDFTSFSKLHTDVKTNNCKIMEAYWAKENDLMVFTIKADRFLRNMVRAIVGTLVEVGRGKITVEDFGNIILQKNRNIAGTSMPGNALFLWKVDYPENLLLSEPE